MPINQELLSDIQTNCFRDTELSIDYQELTDEEVIELVKALKFNSYVKKLSLKFNNISTRGAQSLATLTNLEILDVCANRIGPEGAISLAKSNLHTLDIVGSPIGDDIAIFASMPSLIELHAEECDITDIGAGQLFLSKSIKKLDLMSNTITGKSLENIASNQVLEYLDLSHNQLEGKYCSYIGQNSTLKTLYLTSGFIGDEGAALLAKSCSLEELDLMQCSVRDEGAVALSQNKSLKKLLLSRNYVTEIGVKALINNTTLNDFKLGYNPFDPEEIKDTKEYYFRESDKTFIRKSKLMKKSNLFF